MPKLKIKIHDTILRLRIAGNGDVKKTAGATCFARATLNRRRGSINFPAQPHLPRFDQWRVSHQLSPHQNPAETEIVVRIKTSISDMVSFNAVGSEAAVGGEQ